MSMNLVLMVAALNYNALLPNENIAVKDTDLLRHLLRKQEAAASACVALANQKDKYFGRPQVKATVSTATFRVRKQKEQAFSPQMEGPDTMPTMVAACISDIFKKDEFQSQLRDKFLDGQIAMNIDCRVDVERNFIVRDVVEIQCKANWDYYPIGTAVPQSTTTTMKY